MEVLLYIIIGILIIWRPRCGFFFFFIEYFFILSYLYRVVVGRKSSSYSSISVPAMDVSKLNLVEIWTEISKMSAFVRVYVLCSRRKISIWTVIFVGLAYLLQIPIRLISLVVIFWRCRSKSIRRTFINVFLKKYDESRNLKIEFINNKIYLNCKTAIDLVTLIQKSRPGIGREKCLKLIKELRCHMTEFNKYEQTAEERVEFVLSHLITEEKIKVPKAHYSYTYTTELYHNRGGNVIFHATSQTNNKLSPTQTIATPLPSLVKPGSPNPGTILTKNGILVNKSSSNIKYVSKWEVEYLKYTTLWKFDFEVNEKQYFVEKEKIIGSILYNQPNKHTQDINDVAIGLYKVPLLLSTDEDILNAISWVYQKEKME